VGRAEERRARRRATIARRAELTPEQRRAWREESGPRRTFMDRALHPPEAPEAPPQPALSPEEMARREAEVLASIPEAVRGAPETALMLTRLRSSWANPIHPKVAAQWMAEWNGFLASRPEARKVAAHNAGLFVPGLSDHGQVSGIITPREAR
jgi:hypothetical protein